VSEVFCFCLSLLAPMYAHGQDTPLDDAARSRIVSKIADLLKANYVFPDMGERSAQHIQAQLAQGAYSKLTTLFDFSNRLTADLQSINHDHHVIVFMPQGPLEEEVATAAENELRAKEDARTNFGFEKLEHLPGNVGYLDLRSFADADWAAPTAIGAVSFLASSDAVIIDVRNNHGGQPNMIQLISSYFFDKFTHLGDMYWRKGDRTEQFWTQPYLPGKRMADVPLYILTSSRTFSGPEGFAYDLKILKRATIVGETTGGGANAGYSYPVVDGLAIFITTGRAINPITKTDWEGKGVEPDIKVSASDAFNDAYREALKVIAAQAEDPKQKTEAVWAVDTLDSHMKPLSLSQNEKNALVAVYGHSQITLKAGELYLELTDQPAFRLLPLVPDTFGLEGLDDTRLRFLRDNSGKVTKLVVMYSDGSGNEVVRK